MVTRARGARPDLGDSISPAPSTFTARRPAGAPIDTGEGTAGRVSMGAFWTAQGMPLSPSKVRSLDVRTFRNCLL